MHKTYKNLKSRLWIHTAKIWRALLLRTIFVGVTGSCGKTTTTRFSEAVLNKRGPTKRNSQNMNMVRHVCRAMHTVRPWHRYCVQELSGAKPGMLDNTIDVVRPLIGIVTHIGLDHYKNFRSIQAVAQEKSTLVRRLPANGIAILNIDDPHIKNMREKSAAKIVTYGLNPDADLNAANVTAGWPERLSFDATWHGETVTVQTRLLPPYQIHSVLGAIATGLVTGLTLSECASAVSAVDPEYGRMWPFESSAGITYIIDTWKAPYWTIESLVNYLAICRARRKILVFGSFAHMPGRTGNKYRKIARRALEVADMTLFVGPNASAVRNLAHHAPERLAYRESIKEARDWLDSRTTSGDLVILKGSSIDHLERIFLNQIEQVECWTDSCRLIKHCKDCKLVGNLELPDHILLS